MTYREENTEHNGRRGFLRGGRAEDELQSISSVTLIPYWFWSLLTFNVRLF